MYSSDTRFLSIAQAAEWLNVSDKTIRRRLADGTIPAVRIGRLIRINSADLERAGSPVQYVGAGGAAA